MHVQLGAAISVISITRWNLEYMYIITGTDARAGLWSYTCFLSPDKTPWGCQYAYALGGISIFLSVAVFAMQCISCGDIMSRSSRVCESVLDTMGFAWWLAGAIVFSQQFPGMSGMAQQSSRTGILALCWISAILFLFLAMYNIGTAVRIGKVKKEERAIDEKAAATAV